jgi:hypothetical protein
MIVHREPSTNSMAVLRERLSPYLKIGEFRKGLSLRVAYVALQLVDCLMTVLAVNAGFEELNPVMRGIIDSPVQMVTIKLVLPLVIAWLVPAKLLIPAMVLLMVIIGLNVKELVLFFY